MRPIIQAALVLSVLVQTSAAAQQRPQVVGVFSTAKTRAMQVVYANRHTSFYCDCAFNADKSLNPTACGYIPEDDNIRAHRIEWEHAWGMVLTGAERDLFAKWNQQHPPSVWEIERNGIISAVQGVGNTFVEDHDGGTQAEGGIACLPRAQCCRVCRESQACGDTCVSLQVSCSRGPGCACPAIRLCEE